MIKHTFLVELGTEELPPTQLKTIQNDFVTGFTKALESFNLGYETILTTYATPRRLAIVVKGLDDQAQSKIIEKRGPAKAACFNEDGSLSKAANGWLNANSISFEQASFVQTEKGEWLYFSQEQEGLKAKDVLFDIVKQAINNIQISKSMRWGDHKFSFIRPVHTFTMLLDDQIIPGEVFGIQSSNTIYGHRFLGTSEFTLDHADNYEQSLITKGHVIPCFDQRYNTIKTKIEELASNYNGYVELDKDLLEEVTSLVEFPNPLVGNFDEKFLEVPKEALIHTMQGDQRYFPVFTSEDKTNLLPYFIFVSNIDPEDPSLIIHGNERVIRPRFTDAKFFYEQDLKQSLENLLPRLQTATFQIKLGSIYDKVLRLKDIATFISNKLSFDTNLAQRAATLSKCDLMTNMVFEFTSTQGIMGKYYAQKFGEDFEVSEALFEQYLPRFSGDILPQTNTGVVLSLADKLDTLIGIFGIDQPPKGAKDPFALRRATIGIIRILIEKQLNIDLAEVISYVIDVYGNKLTVSKDQLLTNILTFIQARFRSLFEEQGFTQGEITSVQHNNNYNLSDLYVRLEAVHKFKDNQACDDLIAGNKRIKNFLSKSDLQFNSSVNPQLFTTNEEKALFEQVCLAEKLCLPLYDQHNYNEILTNLASLREVINNFFDNVIVNSENKEERDNRYALLEQTNRLFSLVADISLM